MSFPEPRQPYSARNSYVADQSFDSNSRRNSGYVHPNLRSSDIFYDFDYPNKNDISSPVKNDRYNNQKGSFSTRGSTAGLLRREVSDGSMSERSYNYDGSKSFREAPLPVLDEEQEIRPTKSGASHGKYCADCVNHGLREKRFQEKMMNDEREKQKKALAEWIAHEEKKSSYNYDMDRAQRTRQAKEATETEIHKSLLRYQQKTAKRMPTEEGGMVIHSIFDNHEERTRKMKEMSRSFRDFNLEQAMNKQEKRPQENTDEPQIASLQVGEGYSNKYVPHPETVKEYRKKQVEDSYTAKMKIKEAERQMDQAMVEASARALEKEKREKKEKLENYKRMLSDQLASRAQDREAVKEKKKIENERTRYFATESAEYQKNKDREEFVTEKVKKLEVRKGLEEQQTMNYKQKYEQKKKYYEGTGVSLPVGERKELHPCSGCSTLKEKHHLSHKH